MERITQEQMHDVNHNMIYSYIYHHKNTQQQELSSALNMSRPTLTRHLWEMRRSGLIYASGMLDRELRGRKAIMWSAKRDFRIAIGVEILKETVEIIAVDLYGHGLRWEKIFMDYENSDSYYDSVCQFIKGFIASLTVKKVGRKILGIGIALQGLVSEDGTTITYGEILKCTGLKIDVFSRRLTHPCRFIHEPDGAALCELWVSPELNNAIYLSMSEHLGGAIISKRHIVSGQHRHSATFEHITACKDGEPCYCGKKGCFETICSKTALLRGEDDKEFFSRVRSGDSEAVERWQVFLRYLGRLIAHMHLLVDTQYILGGHLAPFFTEDDIRVLYDYVRERTPFIEEDDYILRSKVSSHNIVIGAALPYIMSFLENVCC